MLNEPDKVASHQPVELDCHFVRGRNALLVRGDFGELFTDYYLHLMQHGIRHEPGQDDLLKDGLAALGLHLASRPRNEAIAWTLSWQDPPQNTFVTGSNRFGNLVGRLFTEDIRERDRDLFICQLTVAGQEPRRSVIEAEVADFFALAESYYRQSEQRPARYFRLGGDRCALVAAQPDCDMEWFAALDEAALLAIEADEELGFLETRHFRFDCGCGPEKIFPLIASMADETLASVFAGGEVIAASCPRCAARYTVTSEALEAYRRDHAE